VINQIRKIYPKGTLFFYEDLKNLSTKLKAKGTILQQHFLSTFANVLRQNHNCLNQLNTFFRKGSVWYYIKV
jgi:hypothetical protein